MNHPADSTPPPPKRWLILCFLLLICFISHFNRASITSAGDEQIMKQYAISPQRMGWVYSSFLIVYTLFMIPGGWLIDRKGPHFALFLMVAGSAVFCACTGAIGLGFVPLAGVWFALLAVRAAMGLCSTPLHPGAARSIDQWFPPGQTALANGLVTGASILAYAAVHPAFGQLIDRVDWPSAFLITGALTFVLAMAWWAAGSDGPFRHAAARTRVTETPEPPPAGTTVIAYETPPPPAPPPPLWRSRELIFLTAGYSAIGYFQYLFFYWLHYYFDSVLKWDKLESRYYAGLPNLAMAAAMPVGGVLLAFVESRHGRGRRYLVPMAAMLAAAACLLVGLRAAGAAWVVTSFTLALGFLGLSESAFWVTAVELGGRRGGTSAAIMNTGGNGIGLLAPILTPLISSRFGWGGGLFVGAMVAVAGALCWLGVRRPPAPPVPKDGA